MSSITIAALRDASLVASRAAFEEDKVARALGPFFPKAKIQRVIVRVLRHRRGRRALIAYTLHLRGPRGGLKRVILIAKAYHRSGRASYVFDVLRQAQTAGLASFDCFRTPAPKALFADWNVIVYERMDGVTLGPESGTSSFARTGAAIAAFHAAQMRFERIQTPEDELLDAKTRLREAAKYFPKLIGVGDSILGCLDRALSSLDVAQPRPLHRDFYHKQVLVGRGAPGFIDLDVAAMGDVTIDAGNFLAHLRLFPEPVCNATGRAFIDALRDTEDLPRPNLHFYEATSLVRLSGAKVVRHGRTRLAMRLLREAHQLIRKRQVSLSPGDSHIL